MKINQGDRALVTGAASGLGLALVKNLAERGVEVLATDVHEDPLPALAAFPSVQYLQLDVTQDVHWARAQDWVVEHWGSLDLLFNNAGVAAGGRIELTEIDQWQWIVDINLLGVVRGCRAFTPMLKTQGSGAIVNTASAAGLVHPPRMSEYNAVKAGVVALSETLFHELKASGVQVSVVCPTFFQTNLTASLRGKDESAQATAAKMIDGSKRTADEIAGIVLDQVERGTHVILTDREGRMAYLGKRFLRPLYYREMAKAALRMGRHD